MICRGKKNCMCILLQCSTVACNRKLIHTIFRVGWNWAARFVNVFCESQKTEITPTHSPELHLHILIQFLTPGSSLRCSWFTIPTHPRVLETISINLPRAAQGSSRFHRGHKQLDRTWTDTGLGGRMLTRPPDALANAKRRITFQSPNRRMPFPRTQLFLAVSPHSESKMLIFSQHLFEV